MHAQQGLSEEMARLKAEGFAMLAELAADIEAARTPTPRRGYAQAVADADEQLWAAIGEGLGREQA